MPPAGVAKPRDGQFGADFGPHSGEIPVAITPFSRFGGSMPPCRRCGRPARSSRAWYCLECRDWADRKRRTSSAQRSHAKSPAVRGYGAEHQRLRRRWTPAVEQGLVECGHCGRLIPPEGPWDLSHPGDNRELPPVPWHRRCNRRFAATTTKRRSNRARKAATRAPIISEYHAPGW